MAFAIWLTGLPGSGKSTVAKETHRILNKKNVLCEIISMDKIRPQISKGKKYDTAERDAAYKKIAEIAAKKVTAGTNVIIDATAHKTKYRNYARELIPKFYEVYVECPLETAMYREAQRKQDDVTTNLYKKALHRLKTGKKIKGLGEVIGVDVEYEKPLNAEIVINSEALDPTDAAENICDVILA